VCGPSFTGGADVLGRLLNCGYMFCLIIFAAAAGQNFDDWARVCAAHGGATTVSLLKYGRGFLSDPVNSRPLLKILVPFSIEIALFFFVGLYLKVRVQCSELRAKSDASRAKLSCFAPAVFAPSVVLRQ